MLRSGVTRETINPDDQLNRDIFNNYYVYILNWVDVLATLTQVSNDSNFF